MFEQGPSARPSRTARKRAAPLVCVAAHPTPERGDAQRERRRVLAGAAVGRCKAEGTQSWDRSGNPGPRCYSGPSALDLTRSGPPAGLALRGGARRESAHNIVSCASGANARARDMSPRIAHSSHTISKRATASALLSLAGSSRRPRARESAPTPPGCRRGRDVTATVRAR